MKKFNKVLVVLSLVLVMSLMFVGCALKPGEGTVTVVIVPTEGDAVEYCVKTSDVADYKNTSDLINYLKTEKGLVYETANGFINKIGSLSPNPSNEFICIMTSVEKDFAVAMDGYTPGTETYKGIKLVDSGLGIESMHVEDGCVILFKIAKWA